MNPHNRPHVEPLPTGMTAAATTITDVDVGLLAAVSSNENAVHVYEAALMPPARRQRMAGWK